MKFLANSLLLFFSLLLVFAGLEVFFFFLNKKMPDRENRLSNFTRQIFSFEGTPVQAIYPYQYHPILGYTGIPGGSYDFGQGKVITQNSKGYQGPDHDYENPQNARRVEILGDSQVWGWKISDGETIAAQLDRLLNDQNGGRKSEVISLGFSGYGIDQSYLQFILEGVRYNPDYAVLVYFPENDLIETVSFFTSGVAKPHFYFKPIDSTPRSELCLGNVPPPKASGWPGEGVGEMINSFFPASQSKRNGYRSPTLEFLSRRILRSQVRDWIKRYFSSAFGKAQNYQDPLTQLESYVPCVTVQPTEDATRDDLKLMLAIVRKLYDDAAKNGVKLLVVGKPAYDDYHSGARSAAYQDFLKQISQQGISVIDMWDIARAKSIPENELYMEQGGHFSPLGNYEIALAIRNFIGENEINALKR